MPESPDAGASPSHRASDVDRDNVASRLADAVSEGRLTLPELDERLERVYDARTYGDLEAVTRDLPAEISGSGWSGSGAPPVTRMLAVMSGVERTGSWAVPARLRLVTLMAGATLDLTRAIFARPYVQIAVTAVMGGVDIIVPDDVTVRLDVSAVMGVRPQFGQPVRRDAAVHRAGHGRLGHGWRRGARAGPAQVGHRSLTAGVEFSPHDERPCVSGARERPAASLR